MSSRRVVFTGAIFLAILASSQAAVVTARSVSLNDVDSAISSASEGDTVVIPSGTASWPATLLLTKGVTIEGAGKDQTVVLDDIAITRGHQPEMQAGGSQGKGAGPMRGGGARGFGGGGGGGRGRLGSSAGQMNERGSNAGALLRIEMTPRQSFRISGITFRPGSIVRERGGGEVPYAIMTQGTCFSFRIDHCHFDQLYRSSIHINGWMYGVIDHCIFDSRGRGSSSVLIQHTNWGGGDKRFGDGSWAEPPYFGSEKFVFLEDNVFNNLGTKQTNGSIDCSAGGRYVARHNTFNNCLALNHGTESSGRLRSSRAIEIYNNTFHFTFLASAGQMRGGTAVIHDNIYSGTPVSHGIGLQIFRGFFPFQTFGGATGNNPWDSNDPHGVYLTGKHTGPNGSNSLVVANAGWSPNQWVGYSVTNSTQTLRNGEHYSSVITANTADTITYKLDNSFGPTMTFNSGDAFAIYKVVAALDQPGRGKGDLLAGNPPVNTASGGRAWPHQALEPIYSWNNRQDDSDVKIHTAFPMLQEKRDYYNDYPRPGYKPYIYPHPLVSGRGLAGDSKQ